MERNQIDLIQTRLKASEIRRLIATIYKGTEDAPALRKILKDIAGGDMVAGQFLEACIDWDARMGHKEDGMWYKSEDSWREQAGFGESQMRRCMVALVEMNLLVKVTKPKGNGRPAPTNHFCVNWGVFWAQLSQLTKKTLGEMADLVFSIVTESRTQVSQLVTLDRHESTESNVTESQTQVSRNHGINSVERKETPTVFHLLSSSEKARDLTTTSVVVVDEKFQKVWDAALNQLEVQLDRANFDTWLRESKLLRVEVGQKTAFVIGVRNNFVKDALEGRLNRTVRRILCDATCICADLDGSQIDVRFEIVGAPPLSPELESPSTSVRKLYEQYIGQVVPDEEPCIQQVSEQYPADEIEAAFVNMSLQKSGGRVRDPWGYVRGILRRRQEMTNVRVM